MVCLLDEWSQKEYSVKCGRFELSIVIGRDTVSSETFDHSLLFGHALMALWMLCHFEDSFYGYS